MYFVKVLSKKILQPTGSSNDTLFKLTMAYDGSGRRISKTSMRKVAGAADWDTAQVTHYTGIGTEIRENYAGPAKQTKVVVNMPQGLGRYGIEDAGSTDNGSGTGDIPNTKFEWYLKNHLGSTMLVYGTQADANPAHSDIGTTLAAYDYRAFGEMVELLPPPTGKVTENFTGKEHDDEIALDYFGARYLDPMLGMWISVDPKRQFASPYLYAGNGMNPVNVIDPDGNELDKEIGQDLYDKFSEYDFFGSLVLKEDWNEMKNIEEIIYFDFEAIDYAYNDEVNTIILPSKKDTERLEDLFELALYGAHEWRHLKGWPTARWHYSPETVLGTNKGIETMKINNTILEGLKQGHNMKYGYDYDAIYGRDYKAYMEKETWLEKRNENKDK